jgi:hypothetical protein
VPFAGVALPQGPVVHGYQSALRVGDIVHELDRVTANLPDQLAAIHEREVIANMEQSGLDFPAEKQSWPRR